MASSDENISKVNRILIEIREEQAPYFTVDDILYYLKKNNGDVEDTIYELLIIKSEDSTISVSGMNTADTSGYFKRLASRYRKFNTGNLVGG